MRIRLSILALAIPVLALTGSVAPVFAATVAEEAEAAKPMSAAELFYIYANRTWRWAAGGVYLAEDRTFRAFSTEGDAPTAAEGRWRITDSGRMCLEGDWHYPGGVATDVTCFLHRMDGGAVYQMAESTGEWSLLVDDSVGAQPVLVRGDEVSDQAGAILAQFPQ